MSDRPFVYIYLKALMESGVWAGLGGAHRGVLIAYLSFADAAGVAYPGTETVARITGSNARNVQRVRADLKEAGFMELEEAGGGAKSGRWRLIIPPAQCATPTPGAVRRPSPSSPPAQHTGGAPGAGNHRCSATPPAQCAVPPPAQRDAYPRRSAPSEHTSEQTIEQLVGASLTTGLAGAVVLTFPCSGKRTWDLTEAKAVEYRQAFPGVTLEFELRKALQWIRDNPTRRKTPKGMPAFLGRWLGKAQADAEARGQTSRADEAGVAFRNPTEEDLAVAFGDDGEAGT